MPATSEPEAAAYLPAILWVLASTAIWTLIFAAAKFADSFAESPMNVFQITLQRYAGALAMLGVLVALNGGLAAHRNRQPLTHLLRAACGTGGAVAITWASARMPIADATAFAMLYGVALVGLGTVFLGERLTRGQALGPAGLLGQYATIRGYRAAPLSVVGPVDYSWLVFAMLLGWLVFAEEPTPGTLAGAALILTGGAMLARGGRA